MVSSARTVIQSAVNPEPAAVPSPSDGDSLTTPLADTVTPSVATPPSLPGPSRRQESTQWRLLVARSHRHRQPRGLLIFGESSPPPSPKAIQTPPPGGGIVFHTRRCRISKILREGLGRNNSSHTHCFRGHHPRDVNFSLTRGFWAGLAPSGWLGGSPSSETSIRTSPLICTVSHCLISIAIWCPGRCR